jgi:hypothetical protein
VEKMKAGKSAAFQRSLQQLWKCRSMPPQTAASRDLLAKMGAGAWLQSCTYCSFFRNEEN